MRYIVTLLVGLLMVGGAGAELAAQPQLVRGSVVAAETGAPIPAAAVVVKGTTIGTQTDDRGAFTLRVPDANATLVVSRIGYARREVPLQGRVQIEVRLSRLAAALDEVVVVGYGAQRRSDITGSVTSVPAERLEEKPNTSVVQALQGSMPGVTVTTADAGAEPGLTIQIRGRNSISASTAPLVVVDGIPYNGALSELNPNDIASIEVLKDASATAIYGSRGSNGVILVTSKRGVAGAPRLTYAGYAGTQSITNLPRLMNAQEFFQFKCDRIRTSPSQSCESVLTATELANYRAGVNTDWVRIGTRTGSQQSHDLSFAGGSEDTRYFLGGSVLRVNGVALNDAFDRATARVNFSQNLRSWLSVGSNSQASQTQRDGVPVNFTTAFQSNPLISPYDSAGKQVRVPWPEDPITSNALENLRAIDEDMNRRLFTSNYVTVTLPRVAGLSYRLNAGADIADRRRGTYYGRDTQTGFVSGGRSTLVGGRRSDWTLENILRFARARGRHSYDLTALYSQAANAFDADTLRAQGFPNDVLGFRSNLPQLSVPAYAVTESKLISQMGRLNYVFDQRYLLTLTARRDGYSGFGRNNKYGVFPSVALAWNISNESFVHWDALDALKLRVSYGKNGNQAIQPYQTFAQLDDRSYLIGDATAPGYLPVTLGNPNLRWESTLSRNVGVDLSLWKERMRLTAEAYWATTSDLLLRRSISSVHGIGSITQNIGKTANRGIELQLNTLNLDRGGWQWRTDLNVSANRNRIVDLYGDRRDDIASGWFIGQPVDVNYGYRFAGIWQTADSVDGTIARSAQPTARPGYVRIVDVNGDGKIDPLDRTFIGSLEPRYLAGLTNSLSYRRLTVSAFVHTVQGVTRPNELLNTNQVLTDVRRNTVYREYWSPTNPINTYPSNSNVSNPQAVVFYEDASFVRLKDVTVAYDLPASLARRAGGESLRLFANGRNLWTRTAWTGLDPELRAQRDVPLERIVTGGLTLRF